MTPRCPGTVWLNSPTEVVGASPEGCDLHETSTGRCVDLSLHVRCSSFRSPDEDVFAEHLHHPHPTQLALIAVATGTSVTVYDAIPRGLLRSGGTSNPVSPSGGSWEDPSGDPPKRGSGTPQKGGCRDTKQCKFWRVSSVLIQGTFCFLAFFGGFRGVPKYPVRGSEMDLADLSFWGVSRSSGGP